MACIRREHGIHVLLIEADVEAVVVDDLATRLISHVVMGTCLSLLVHWHVVRIHVHLFTIVLFLVEGGVVDRMVIAGVVLLQFINFVFIVVRC